MRIMRSLLSSRTVAAIGGAACALVIAGGGYAIASGAGTITACVHKHGRGLYAGPCARRDHRLIWNVIGPQGGRGDPGPTGPSTGPAGGALASNYPNPTLATGAVSDNSIASNMASVPVAGGIVYDDGTNTTVVASFNRLGGRPSVTHPSTGTYDITIPGLNYVWYQNMAQVTPLGGLHFEEVLVTVAVPSTFTRLPATAHR